MITKEKMQEFLDRLEGPEGCDFQQSDPDNIETMTWKCGGHLDISKATAILHAMEIPEKDLIDVLRMAAMHGGYCDCEILFNAKDDLLEWAERLMVQEHDPNVYIECRKCGTHRHVKPNGRVSKCTHCGDDAYDLKE